MFVRISAPARKDILEVLEWTELAFGRAARKRYEVLIAQALTDLSMVDLSTTSDTPLRLPEGAGAYHLSRSRMNVPAEFRVRSPRHFLAFEIVDEGAVIVLRLIHDRSEVRFLFDKEDSPN